MLSLMNKKSKVIDNIKAIKFLVENQIDRIVFNIIIDFPGVDENILEENRKIIQKIRHLFKPNIFVNFVEFDLERDSIAYKIRTTLNLTNTSNFKSDTINYPKNLSKRIKLHNISYKWNDIPNGWKEIKNYISDCQDKNLTYAWTESNRITIYDKTRDGTNKYHFKKYDALLYDFISRKPCKINKLKDSVKIQNEKLEQSLSTFIKYNFAVKVDNHYFGLAILNISQ